MRSIWMMVALLGASFAAHAVEHRPVAAASDKLSAATEATRQTVLAGLRDAAQSNTEDANAELYEAVYDSQFAQLPEDLRYKALLVLGMLVMQDANRQGEAHGLLVRATALDQADGNAWLERSSTAFALGDYADSARSVTAIARRWPDVLRRIFDQPIYIIDTKLAAEPAQTAIRQAMLQALFDARWTDRDGEPSTMWRELSSLLLVEGKTVQAAAVASRITSARVILSMRVDKRFDALVQRDPQAFDVDRTMAAELAAARAAVAAHPDRLRPLTTLQTLLLDTGQYRQVLAVTDAVMANVRAGKGKSTYKDFDDRYVWIIDQRARALARLGRWNEAAEQWAAATRQPEQGGMNVSQIINLGDYYANRREPIRALDMVAELGNMSPYGRMNLELVRLKVAVQQHDQAGTAAHLAYMRAHRNDAIALWQRALLVNGDLDGAADLLLQRLHNPAWRSSALVDMQRYDSVRMTPVEAEINTRWNKVVAQPAVQKALQPVGRIESFRLDPDQL